MAIVWHFSPSASQLPSLMYPASHEGACALDAALWEGKDPVYLLSDHLRIMACIDLERAIIRPQVYGCCNTRDAAFEDLAL